MITTVRVGGVFPDIPHIGDALPLGSVIALDRHSHERYTQEAPRTWVSGKSLINASYLSMPLILTELAGMDEVALPPESERQFLWRIRDTALATVDRNSNNMPAARRLVEELGAKEPLFTEGGVVSNSYDLKKLPMGAVAYSGHPSVPSLLNVWTQSEGGLRHTFGPHSERYAGQPLTIYSLPGETVIEDEKPLTPEELDRLAMRVWRVARAHQRMNSWCGVVDSALRSLGIDGVATEGARFGVGDLVDRDQAAQLPEGSLLWWRWRTGGAFAVYRRDNAARNRSRTRRIAGFRDNGDNSHERMKVIQVPGEPMMWSLNGQFLQELPNGVRFTWNETDVVLDDDVRRRVQTWVSYTIREWTP